jgi:two-component system response regulator AtoC
MPKARGRPDDQPTVFHGMVTVSPHMLQFFATLERVAKSEANVLIRGESGTGKELVARAIHALSDRTIGPFHALNCATLTSELMQSELFGHVKGAFTGAIAERKGLFAAAHNGTLFLDEIAEMPADLQPRLLRVLQERQFSPVGSFKTIRANIRLVSATHRSLRNLVDEGKFRADLMYRIRVVPLFLPRLADRGRDVEVLTWRFIDEFNKQKRRVIDSISVDAIEALYTYQWPGNVRELRNNIEYAFAVGEGDTLQMSDLTPELRGEPAPVVTGSANLRVDEIQSIRQALRAAGHKRSVAAEKLGISRATLWRKIREYRLDSELPRKSV